MAVKKASVESTMAKVEAVTKATEKKTTEAVKADAKAETKAPAKEAEAKKAPAKKAPAKETEAKKAPAKKAPVKKAATKAETKTETKFIIEYAGGQVSTETIVAKAVEASGKKSIKALNVYYQPETGMIYFTADGEEGSVAL